MIGLGMVGGLRLPEHSHCKFCGDPIPFGQEFCDEECRAAEIAREKAEKRRSTCSGAPRPSSASS